MKYAIKLYTALSLVFILLLSISGSISGIFSDLVYVCAFALPAICGVYLSGELHRKREEEAGVSLENKWYYRLEGESLKLLLPLAMPVILTVMLISFLTALLLSLFGLGNPPIEQASLPEMLIMHALVPAILEELMFRYVPLKLILPYSRWACIVISSVYFAVIHCNLFTIPYALAAGAIFISLDIAFDSVLPSLILHFLNNAMSVVMIKYCNSTTSYLVYAFICVAFLAISVPFIYKFRLEYKGMLNKLKRDKRNVDSGYYPLLLIIPTVIIAFMNLL